MAAEIQSTIAAKVLGEAAQLFSEGRVSQAEALFRHILAHEPDNCDVMNALAIIHAQRKQFREAEQLLDRAIRIRSDASFYCNLGNVLREQGQVARAFQAYQSAVECGPEFPEALSNIGGVLVELGRPIEAEMACRKAITLRPDFPEAHVNLGNALREQSKIGEAKEEYRAAISLRPEYAEAYRHIGVVALNEKMARDAEGAFRAAIRLAPSSAEGHMLLGDALYAQQRFDEAEKAYRTALRLEPRLYEGYCRLGSTLKQLGRAEEAESSLRSAIRLLPTAAAAHNELGIVLASQARWNESIDAYNTALTYSPDSAEIHTNLGSALLESRREIEALDAYRRAISLRPNFAAAHLNYSLALLRVGRFREGWAEYEWRLKVENDPAGPQWPLPHWGGEALGEKRLLIYSEQGFGDIIQFSRFLTQTQAKCQDITFICPPELKPLMVTSFRNIKVISSIGAPPNGLENYHYCCSLLSLPLLLNIDGQDLPSKVPYLHPDTAAVGDWAERLRDGSALNVGIVWTSNPRHPAVHRSVPFEKLEGLWQVGGIRWVSLQAGSRASELAWRNKGEAMDLSDEFDDFGKTAAVIANLDLVIAVDTAVTHLTGALGKPIWLMLSYLADWRWLLDRSDSPWYPTMRLFRQTRAGAWDSVVDAVRNELVKRSARPPVLTSSTN